MNLEHPEHRPYISVVGGILWRGKQFLAAQRPEGATFAGLWELPGGKVEDGESLQEALTREIEEELGVAINSPSFCQTVFHDYGDAPISLHFFHITSFIGEPKPLEGQTLRWVTPKEAEKLPFLEADKPLLRKLQEESDMTIYSD